MQVFIFKNRYLLFPLLSLLLVLCPSGAWAGERGGGVFQFSYSYFSPSFSTLNDDLDKYFGIDKMTGGYEYILEIGSVSAQKVSNTFSIGFWKGESEDRYYDVELRDISLFWHIRAYLMPAAAWINPFVGTGLGIEFLDLRMDDVIGENLTAEAFTIPLNTGFDIAVSPQNTYISIEAQYRFSAESRFGTEDFYISNFKGDMDGLSFGISMRFEYW